MISGASANPLSLIAWGNYRITILTSRCLRIEYNSKLFFEDRPSRTFSHRNHPLPRFKKEMNLDLLKIETDDLTITLTDFRNPPKNTNCRIQSNYSEFLWDFTLPDQSSTFSDPSLGYTIIDDSHTPVLSKDGVYLIRNKSEIDLYFFGYGKSIFNGIADFFLLSGSPELPPLYSFKISFTSQTITDAIKIFDNFSTKNIFFGSCFLDTSWHTQDQLFSWNQEIFDKLDDLKKKRFLKIGITVDILKGVSPKEAQYRDFSQALKLELREIAEYSTKKTNYLNAFQKYIFTPLENDGVDFFQINEELYALNRAYFRRKVNFRPLLLTKFRELGCQRWPLPISPKKCESWKDLSSLPNYFSNLSNQGIIYELFEINNIEKFENDFELIVRIFQFASLLPIVRISIPPNFPWNLDSSITCFILNAMSFHNELEPFFYSLGYQSVINRKPIINSMRNCYSQDNSSSLCPCQFCLGSDGDIIAAPFVTKIDEETNHANNAVWMPNKTIWFDFETGREYGGGWHGIHGKLSSIPLFVKAGSIIPTKSFNYNFNSNSSQMKPVMKTPRNTKITYSKSTASVSSNMNFEGVLTIHVFPKGSKKFQIFDDGDGDDKAYKNGKFTITTIETRWDFKGFEESVPKTQNGNDDGEEVQATNQTDLSQSKKSSQTKTTSQTKTAQSKAASKNVAQKRQRQASPKNVKDGQIATEKVAKKAEEKSPPSEASPQADDSPSESSINEAKRMMIVFDRTGDPSLFNRNREMVIRLHNVNPHVKVTTDNNSEISNERIEYNDVTFDIKIIKFPTVVIVRTYITGELLALDRTRMTSAELTSVLKAANMTTWVTQSHMDSFPKGTFFPRLTASSHVLPVKIRLLLLEELEDCGFCHFTKEMGNELFVVWNNSDSDLFTYLYKRFEPLKKEEITESSGVVPPALYFSPEKELTVRHRHLVDLPTAETLLELIICDTLMFSIDFDKM